MPSNRRRRAPGMREEARNFVETAGRRPYPAVLGINTKQAVSRGDHNDAQAAVTPPRAARARRRRRRRARAAGRALRPRRLSRRPVKIVVANTPGGPSDLVGRIVAAALGESTGKTFIIENRGGAGGNIGMGYVAHSEPDGYTYLLATSAYSVNVGLYNHLPFDPMKDFVAVSELAGVPNIFVVRKESPAKSMKEFIDLARADPSHYNISVPPIGTTPQLQATLLKAREKLPKVEEVVFKGGGDALQALLTSTVQIASNSLGPSSPH